MIAKAVTAKYCNKIIRQLVNFEKLLNNLCLIIHICTDDQADAYRLFRVLNDRGLALSDCDHLRAFTLERLDKKSSQTEFQQAEQMWDDIQERKPNEIQNCLRWLYAAHTGQSVNAEQLFDRFCNHFFPATSGAKKMLATITNIKDSMDTLTTLMRADWPFPPSSISAQWDRNRLKAIVDVLHHEQCLPLLYAVQLVNEKEFTNLIHLLDKFFYRYKILCRAHASHMTKVYLSHAKIAVADPKTFKREQLENDLRDLLTKYAGEALFESALKTLKYLLITLEENWKWVQKGATGGVQRRKKDEDKARVFDFKKTTIEHVYPQKAAPADVRVKLEPLKHDLGNLTILDPNTNMELGNSGFNKKRKGLKNTNITLNRDEICKKSKWSPTEVAEWRNTLVNAALKVFMV